MSMDTLKGRRYNFLENAGNEFFAILARHARILSFCEGTVDYCQIIRGQKRSSAGATRRAPLSFSLLSCPLLRSTHDTDITLSFNAKKRTLPALLLQPFYLYTWFIFHVFLNHYRHSFVDSLLPLLSNFLTYFRSFLSKEQRFRNGRILPLVAIHSQTRFSRFLLVKFSNRKNEDLLSRFHLLRTSRVVNERARIYRQGVRTEATDVSILDHLSRVRA